MRVPGVARFDGDHKRKPAGNRLSLDDNHTGRTSYTYDVRNEETRITQSGTKVAPERADFSYDAAGRKATASHPNGTRGTFTYDAGGRLTNIQWTGPANSAVMGLSYSYDAAGNTTHTSDSSGTNSYTYDRLDRLSDAQYSDGSSEAFTYDSAGNRTGV